MCLEEVSRLVESVTAGEDKLVEVDRCLEDISRLIELIIESEEKLLGIEGEVDADVDETEQGSPETVTVTVVATQEADTVLVRMTLLVFVWVEVLTIVAVVVRRVVTSAVGHTGQSLGLRLSRCAALATVNPDIANINNFAKENEDMTTFCSKVRCLESLSDI
jgi:hypothetical protein